jgi:hypothetical protein
MFTTMRFVKQICFCDVFVREQWEQVALTGWLSGAEPMNCDGLIQRPRIGRLYDTPRPFSCQQLNWPLALSQIVEELLERKIDSFGLEN